MKAESASVCHQLSISISVQDNAPHLQLNKHEGTRSIPRQLKRGCSGRDGGIMKALR